MRQTTKQGLRILPLANFKNLPFLASYRAAKQIRPRTLPPLIACPSLVAYYSFLLYPFVAAIYS